MPKARTDTTRCYTCSKRPRRIRVMIFRGTGYCSEQCRKAAMAKAGR